MIEVTFGSLQTLVFFPLLISLCGLVLWRGRAVIRLTKTLVADRWQAVVMPGYSRRAVIIKSILLCIGALSLFIALLRPQWGMREETVKQQGRDVLIALDISRSMLAQDLKPNRLSIAKLKIKELLHRLSCERVGLMLFSGSAIMQCPLTTDYGAFMMFLDAVDAESVSAGTTAIDQAVRSAVTLFERMPERKHKLLVIFTDGEDFSSNLVGIKQKAQQLGLTIFTLGVATPEGAPVPVLDASGKSIGVQRDAQGKVVISALNEGILSNLAHDTAGHYWRVTPDNTDLEQLVSTVERYEKEQLEDKQISHYNEQYPWFVGVALICLAVEWLL